MIHASPAYNFYGSSGTARRASATIQHGIAVPAPPLSTISSSSSSGFDSLMHSSTTRSSISSTFSRGSLRKERQFSIPRQPSIMETDSSPHPTMAIPSVPNIAAMSPVQQQRASLSALPAAVNLDAMAAGSNFEAPPHPSAGEQPAKGHRRQRQTRYVTDDFVIRRTLGTGSFGRVHLAQSKHNMCFYAVKVLSKAKVYKLKQVEHTNSERAMLARVFDHPFFVRLWGTFQDSENLYMIMDFVPGGELFSLIRRSQKFPNAVAKFYAAEVAIALDFLHAQSIVYRDLKPENILIAADGHIKLTDFGFAKEIEDWTWTLCGTPDYLAPEIVKSQGYNLSVDWYALGVLIFEMLAGFPPFHGEATNPVKLYEKIMLGNVNYPSHFDPLAKSLIQSFLTSDLTKRIGNLKDGSRDVFLHPWFAEVSWPQLFNRELTPPFVPNVSADGDSSAFEKYKEIDVSQYGAEGFDEFGHLFPDFG